MGSLPGKFVKAFSERTQKNLKVIDDLKNKRNLGHAEVFEITQLVNSCLGLIVFPRQKCFNNVPKTPLTQLRLEGWPIPRDEGGFPPAQNLNELIGRLRNGITHGRLEFSYNEQYKIESLVVWDEKSRKKNWQAKFCNMDELRGFVVKFSDMLTDGSFCFQCSRCSG